MDWELGWALHGREFRFFNKGRNIQSGLSEVLLNCPGDVNWGPNDVGCGPEYDHLTQI